MESFHRTVVGIPALLGNPHFKMTEFLKQRVGDHTPTEEGHKYQTLPQKKRIIFGDFREKPYLCCQIGMT